MTERIAGLSENPYHFEALPHSAQSCTYARTYQRRSHLEKYLEKLRASNRLVHLLIGGDETVASYVFPPSYSVKKMPLQSQAFSTFC